VSRFVVASLGSIKRRRELIAANQDVAAVALDLFQLGREREISEACDCSLSSLLRLALADYRDRYRDTRREHLVRRDLSTLRDGYNNAYRSIACLFCAKALAIRATTRESYRIAQLMIESPTDADRDISIKGRGGCFAVKLADEVHRQLWCVADVSEAIRPHVVTCALTSLGRLQVPVRPDAAFRREPAEIPLFADVGELEAGR
jgi:hypothetical protein